MNAAGAAGAGAAAAGTPDAVAFVATLHTGLSFEATGWAEIIGAVIVGSLKGAELSGAEFAAFAAVGVSTNGIFGLAALGAVGCGSTVTDAGAGVSILGLIAKLCEGAFCCRAVEVDVAVAVMNGSAAIGIVGSIVGATICSAEYAGASGALAGVCVGTTSTVCATIASKMDDASITVLGDVEVLTVDVIKGDAVVVVDSCAIG